MKADVKKLAYIGSKPGDITSRDSDSWYTPNIYTDMTRKVLGTIDLDPFSSSLANEYVKAERYFDADSNAFKQIWFKEQGTVFMNPPYSRKLIDKAVEIFLQNISDSSISQAVVLVNNATETKWFQSLTRKSDALCLVDKRIPFESFDGKHSSGNTRGQVFLYYGVNKKAFKKVFKEIGIIISPY
ncbi:DNA N-6-adenine-methyltransferase [Colwellia psychrerythraea]|uniref:DNA N-6-adenine-methyltransferase n=1 Tax=Colwellia psychrerythraea TaxID=28229 RepID=A0A099KMA3_COLPS|nr:DNA N-6-adenine-methyltransferase [Colwellia psychrerythraea]KGJ91576.1 DNA N-6-adenine-methyltransferase [Colwellia psychrerythraea]